MRFRHATLRCSRAPCIYYLSIIRPKNRTSKVIITRALSPQDALRASASRVLTSQCFVCAGQSPLSFMLFPICMANVCCSWLPLLFIRTNASPAFIFLFFVCTYFLNRPCVYCSFLLLILFLTSCNWSDRCFFDFSSNWFQPRPSGSYVSLPGCCSECYANATANEDLNTTATAVVAEMANTTAGVLVNAATEQIAKTRAEWTGLGMEWLRSLLGKREWRIDCLDVNIRL